MQGLATQETSTTRNCMYVIVFFNYSSVLLLPEAFCLTVDPRIEQGRLRPLNESQRYSFNELSNTFKDRQSFEKDKSCSFR